MPENIGTIVGQVVIDTAGSVSSLEKMKRKTDETSQSYRQFLQEQKLQNRISSEATQAITGITFALALLSQGQEGASREMKVMSNSLMAGVMSMNAAEFSMFTIGKSAASLGGTIGQLGTKLMGMSGVIGLVVGIGATLISFFNNSKDSAEDAKTEFEKFNKSLSDQAQRINELGQSGEFNERQRLDSLRNLADKAEEEAKRLESWRKVIDKEQGRYENPQATPWNNQPRWLLDPDSPEEWHMEATGSPDEQRAARKLADQLRRSYEIESKRARDKAGKDAEREFQEEQKREVERQQIRDKYTQKDAETKEEAFDKLFQIEQEMNLKVIGDKYEREEAAAEQGRIKRNADIADLVDATMMGDEAVAEKRRLMAESDKQYAIEIGEIRNRYEDEVREKQIKSMDEMLSAVDRLGNALYRAFGQDAAWIQTIFSLIQALGELSKVSAKSDKSDADTVGIIASILGLFGGFASGGYTGNAPRNKIAGVVHGGEIVFEKPIVDRFGSDLMLLRSQLQSAKGYAGGGIVGAGFNGGKPGYMIVDMINGRGWFFSNAREYDDFKKRKFI